MARKTDAAIYRYKRGGRPYHMYGELMFHLRRHDAVAAIQTIEKYADLSQHCLLSIGREEEIISVIFYDKDLYPDENERTLAGLLIPVLRMIRYEKFLEAELALDNARFYRNDQDVERAYRNDMKAKSQ